MRASRFLFGALIAVAWAASAQAQGGVCTLKVSEAPEIRGLRLGMSPAQLSARYPRLPAIRTDEYGQAHIILDNPRIYDETAFKDVEQISLKFIDGRLVTYQVSYSSLPWDNLDQFMTKLLETYRLPGGWQGAGTDRQTLTCDRFRIDTGWYGRSDVTMATYVRLQELDADAVIRQRIVEKRERERQTFKP